MPFKPIDFANIEPQGNPFFKDLISNLMTGYKAAQVPSQLEREKKKEELANQMQEYLVKEQPEKFASEQLSREFERAFTKAQTGKINTMTPLEAAKMALENSWYGKKTQAEINANEALANYRNTGGGGGGTEATAKAQRAFENSIARDNPELSPDALYEASNVLREGGDQLSDGTKLNPLSSASQTALDKVIRSSTTPTATASKKTMHAIEGAIPLIDKLLKMEEPNQVTGTFWSPNAQADYMDTVTTLKERLIGSLNFPRTNQGARELSHTTTRQPLEGSENYHARLKRLRETLMGQYSIAKKYSGATSTPPAGKNKEKYWNAVTKQWEYE